MKSFLIFIISFLFSTFLFCQQSSTDSLEALLPETTGLERLSSLKKISYPLCRNARTTAKGITHAKTGIEYLKAVELSDTARLRWEYEFKIDLSNAYFFSQQFEEAHRYSSECIRLANKEISLQHPKGEAMLGRAHIIPGHIFFLQKKLDDAIENYRFATKHLKNSKDRRSHAVAQYSLAGVLAAKKDWDGALPFYLESAGILRQIGLEDLHLSAQTQVAAIYNETGKFAAADSLFTWLLKECPEKAPHQMAYVLAGKGRASLELGKPAEGIEYYRQAIAYLPTSSTPDLQQNLYLALSEVYEKTGDKAEALLWFKKHKAAADSLSAKVHDEKLAELQTRFQVAEKEKAAQDAELRALRHWFTWLVTLVLLLAVLAGAAFYATRTRRKAQEAHRQAETLQALASKDREISLFREQLYTNLTHELHTFLTLVITPLEQLFKKNTGPLAETALRNARQLQHYFNDLLKWKKLEDKALNIQTQVADIPQEVRRMVSRFELQAAEKTVQVYIFTELQSCWAEMDFDKLDTIVTNLMSNALKFSSENGWVCFDLNFLEMDGKSSLRISVCNFLEYVPQEKLQRIFERYEQAAPAEKGGFGIGLALVKGLTDLLGGSVEVISEQGHGVVFTVSLPFQPIERAKDNGQPEEETNAFVADGARQLAIVVEDNDELRNFITGCLRANWQTLEAGNGEQGLALVQKKLPDLVISDIMMPGEPNGFALCQALKRDPLTCHIPILMLTGRSSQQAKMDALEAGADSYLTKPFDVDELLATSQNLLENRRRISERTKVALQVQWTEEPACPVEDPFLELVMEQIRKHIDDAGFGVEQMADALRISRQQLFKKVKSLTGMPPADFLRNLRLEKARRLLETGVANVSQAAYECGFDDPNYFSKAFKKHFGISPSEALKATFA